MSEETEKCGESLIGGPILNLDKTYMEHVLFGDEVNLDDFPDDWLFSEFGEIRIIRNNNWVISSNFKNKNNVFVFNYSKERKQFRVNERNGDGFYELPLLNVDLLYNKFLETIQNTEFISDIKPEWIYSAYIVDYAGSLGEWVKHQETINIENLSVSEFFEQKRRVEDVYLFEMQCCKLLKRLKTGVNLLELDKIIKELKNTIFYDKLKTSITVKGDYNE